VSKIRILVVDDEEDILEFLGYNLKKEGYLVETANDGVEGLRKVQDFEPHLILLDVMMPNMDGVEFCEKLRANKKFNDTLVAFLTARNETFMQITALETGGDDFISKPIKPKVLLARIKAILRRHTDLKTPSDDDVLEFGDLKIYPNQFIVEKDNESITLPKKEFQLLSLLASKPGKVFKRQEIMHKIWGDDVIVGDRTIDVHIRKLREKIGESYISTLKGIGYRFDF
jgi:two-component system alkaline phosphatase synthesis response regulator PhoP